jgi:TetR/AcrR family transcriptional repressor of nem operon
MDTQHLTARGERTRARIVATAASVMEDRGVEAASCEQILALAKASKSQLYHYFHGKDELVRAVIELRFREALEHQQPWLEHLDTFDGIRTWFDAIIELNRASGTPGCILGTLAAELADRDEAARCDLAQCFTALEGYLTEGLRAMQARGELTNDADPETLASGAYAAMQGGLLQAKARKDPQLLVHALDAAFTYLRSASTG